MFYIKFHSSQLVYVNFYFQKINHLIFVFLFIILKFLLPIKFYRTTNEFTKYLKRVFF